MIMLLIFIQAIHGNCTLFFGLATTDKLGLTKQGRHFGVFEMLIAVRKPQRINTFSQIFTVLDPASWICLLISIVVMSCQSYLHIKP